MRADSVLVLAALLVAAAIAVASLIVVLRMRRVQPAPTIANAARPPADRPPAAAVKAAAPTPIPWDDALIDTMNHVVHGHGFGTANLQFYPVAGEHAEVIERVRKGAPAAAARRDYFPRKPQVLPRLLVAIRNSESSIKELTDIIRRDPVLAGDVLRMANTAYYRGGKEAVDSIDRAVVLLGLDGLRILVAGAVMQPVFRVPRGYFEAFSPMVWRQAQHAAVAAEAYARATRGDCDPFAAHLLSLVYYVSHIVLFRMTVESYVAAAGSLPRADVFARVIDECAEPLACDVAKDWGLSETMVGALTEHVERRTVDAMSPLARALYFGRLCGTAVVALAEGATDEGELLSLMARKGLAPEQATKVWTAVRAFEGSAGPR